MQQDIQLTGYLIMSSAEDYIINRVINIHELWACKYLVGGSYGHLKVLLSRAWRLMETMKNLCQIWQ
jgi:hypothetical protein